MIRPGRGHVVATLVVLAGLTGPARAQSSEELRARALFEGGSKRYDAGDLHGALELWREAYKVLPRAKILLNIARLHQKLGDDAAAANQFAAYLARDDADTSVVPVVRNELSKLDARLGKLVITARSAGDVRVDGTTVGVGPGTLTVRVKPGNHSVSATGSSQQLRTGAGKTSRVELEATTATPPVRTSRPVSIDPGSGPAAGPSDVSRPLWKRTWMWTGLLTAGIAATGVVFGLQSRSAADDVNRLNAESTMHDFSQVQPLVDRAESRATLANISFIAAGVTGVLTIYLGLTDKSARRPTANAAVAPIPGGAMAAYTTSF